MKSYLSLIPISAKVRKRQNRMTVLCIIISVFLVTAIFSVADMMIRTESDFMISNHGNWHIAIKNISQNNADEISNRSDVTAVGVASQFNFEGEQPYRVNEKRTALYGTDEVYITQISNGIVEGTFPANDEEVMLTPNSVTALGVQLGDSVTLHTPAGDRTFTISGFGTDDESYYNNQTYLIGSYLTQSAFTSVMAQNGVTNNELTYYVQFESAAKAANAITELQTQYQLSDGSISENTGVMGMAGQSNNTAMQSMYGLAAILFVLVLLAGILMISGSMNSIIAQRTQFFGMLRYLYFVADAEFNRLLEKYNLKEADYYDRDNPLGIALDRNIEFDRRLEKFVTLDTLKGDGCVIEGLYYVEIDGYYRKDSRIDENGNKVVLYQNRDNESDIIELPYEESFAKYTLRSEKTIEEAPFFVSRSTPVAINMIYPYSMLESVVPEAALNQFRNTEYFLTSSNHAASFENLATMLTENGLSSRQLFDYAANAETNRNVVTIIRVFAYGFIVLISLIAAANVFNTISTNISLRRREFAMLKSVGMTQKGFRRMMNYECLLYGSKALLLGLPVSCGITYLIYRAVTTAYETSFHLPWAAIGIAVLSVFLVVFATMMYAMRKVKKDNPIDALKNENL